MLLGLDESIWKMILLVLVLPVLTVGALNVIYRKRGGISQGWGGVLVVALAGIVGVLVILDKVRL
ncbi:hypothetical protein [Luteimonas fraxinea]|uniref:Uncharacterized protein n=2 Tax=Luteimonas fraxinea TaxID=2901869 RepID=A0ABS8U8C5_9GAMM|nr:hypothetical protein [Luteimonas fraxinea]MCD9095384.1 hypothetical protein [Luteimonas fraxinea]MCD9126376.1 hypothetical protein [Luteimonas fraxinea]